MSMHKKPLTEIEEKGLRAHGLDIGTPSQLSDCFRLGVAWQEAQPIDMILHCPNCHEQHIDEVGTQEEFHGDGGPVEVVTWDNPPHRSHLCKHCGMIWRPADVCTNGVASIKTKGKLDTQVLSQQEAEPLEDIAEKLWDSYRHNHPSLGLKDLPSWIDLPDKEKARWRAKAQPPASVPQGLEEFIATHVVRPFDSSSSWVPEEDLRTWMAGHARVLVELAAFLKDREELECILEYVLQEEQTINVGPVQQDEHDEFIESSAGWLARLLRTMIAASQQEGV